MLHGRGELGMDGGDGDRWMYGLDMVNQCLALRYILSHSRFGQGVNVCHTKCHGFRNNLDENEEENIRLEMRQKVACKLKFHFIDSEASARFIRSFHSFEKLLHASMTHRLAAFNAKTAKIVIYYNQTTIYDIEYIDTSHCKWEIDGFDGVREGVSGRTKNYIIETTFPINIPCMLFTSYP